ncbi:hypothetical protein MMC10_003058 [Thelotrema lepadinum]|nr:hypothetical protein [Thelotrema lepadinum]
MAAQPKNPKLDVEKAIGSPIEPTYPKIAVQSEGGIEKGKNENTLCCGISPNLKSQVWHDLEGETGFTSYEAYIGKYVEQWPQFRQFLALLQGVREKDEYFIAEKLEGVPRRGYFYLYEADKDGNLSEGKSYEGTFNEDLAGSILQFVRTTSDTVITRFIFIEIAGDEDLPACFIDALGLGLRLDPRVLISFLQRKIFDRLSLVYGHSCTARRSVFESNPLAFRFMTEPQPLNPSFVGIGPFVLAYADDISTKDRLPPVLLLLSYATTDRRHGIDLGLEISEAPLFTTSAARDVERPWKWPLLMTSLTKKWLKQRPCDLNQGNFPLYWILAFLQMQTVYLKSYCRRGRSEYLRLTLCEGLLSLDHPEQDTRAQLHHQWLFLRRSIEDSRDGLYQFKKIVTGILGETVHKEDIMNDVSNEFDAAIAESIRLELEMKDYLQLQVGDLALQESRKSIELSNAQIEEAKRVKIGNAIYFSSCKAHKILVTLLAFIYVPLNLATSIFGMNIQQINATGPDMPFFVYTALGILGATIFCWFSIAQHEGYHQWQSRTQRGRGGLQIRHTSGYCLTARITMLIWLLRHGHASWLWSTNAWIGLLTDDLLGSFKSESTDSNSACDYVTRYYKNEHNGPGPFSTEHLVERL